jgi:hypothetical protein
VLGVVFTAGAGCSESELAGGADGGAAGVALLSGIGATCDGSVVYFGVWILAVFTGGEGAATGAACNGLLCTLCAALLSGVGGGATVGCCGTMAGVAAGNAGDENPFDATTCLCGAVFPAPAA